MKKSDGKWYWADSNEPINYNIRWSPSEPNNLSGSETCLNITSLGVGLNDDRCDRPAHFLCEETAEVLSIDPRRQNN